MGCVRRVLVVGGSPEPSSAETVRAAARGCDAVVAVDRGLDALLASGLSCDLFCGDADSVSEKGAALVHSAEESLDPAFEVVRYNPHKDDTDLGLALGEVLRRWPEARIVATCMSGGNPDHELAVLGRLSAWSGELEVKEDRFDQRFLKSGDVWDLSGHEGERFTFVPLSCEAVVSERSMRWELDHKHVPLLSDLGVSNVIESGGASITCHEGLVVAWVFRS